MSSPTPNTPNLPGTPNTVNDRMMKLIFAGTPEFAETALVALFLVWMFVLRQARLTGGEKLMRIAVIVFITAIAIIQSRPRG